MNIKRAKEEIKHTIAAYLEKDGSGRYMIPEIRQRPLLLMGPPGVGKTQIMEQIAGELDIALVAYTITHHTRQSAIGLPFIREKEYGGEKYSVTEYTMSEIIASVYDRMESSGKKEGILFIDEINCVSETLAPTMLQFLQGKTFGNQKVPSGWIIVAAGNPPEYNRSVREFDVVTLDRIRMIPVEADYDIWKEYAQSVGVHPGILSYLDIRRDHFYRMETTVDGKLFVTARGWQDLSEMVYACERLGFAVDREVTGQYLQHPAVAKDFANYLELYYKYRADYQIDEILAGTIRPGTLNKLKFAPFDERTKVVSLLLSSLNEYFRRVCAEEDVLQKLHGFLMEVRDRVSGSAGTATAGTGIAGAGIAGAGGVDIAGAGIAGAAGTATAMAAAGQILARERLLLQSRLAAGQNERTLQKEEGLVLDELEKLSKLPGADAPGNEGFGVLREAFAGRVGRLTKLAAEASEKLEHGFDFMEAAFGESQEMVIFITELSVHPFAVRFLKGHPCDRYFMYNKSLLFADREAKIRQQLDDIRDLQIT